MKPCSFDTTAEAELRRLPGVLVTDLGDGAVELVGDAILDAPETIRFSFSEWLSGTINVTRQTPTTMTTAATTSVARDLLDLVRLDDVALLDVVEVLEPDTALVALHDLADVVLEAAQRRQLAVVDLHRVADQPHLRVAA